MAVYPGFNPTPLRAGDFPMLSRPVTIASGANAAGAVLARGTVLGAITAGGKLTRSAAAATDGSQTPKAILAADVDASAADVVAPAYYTGEFADLMMTFGAGHTQATVDAAFAASGQPIFIRKVGAVA